VGTRLRTGEHLLYLGTFFTVLESRVAFERLGDHLLGPRPFDWHISLPVGTVLDRVAGHMVLSEPETGKRITAVLSLARTALEREGVRGSAQFAPWQVGLPTGLPELCFDSPGRQPGDICASAVATFAGSLRKHCAQHGISRLRVTGGLSGEDWLLRYFEATAGVQLERIEGDTAAAGAASLALAALEGRS
jgi:hypothetical protein